MSSPLQVILTSDNVIPPKKEYDHIESSGFLCKSPVSFHLQKDEIKKVSLEFKIKLPKNAICNITNHAENLSEFQVIPVTYTCAHEDFYYVYLKATSSCFILSGTVLCTMYFVQSSSSPFKMCYSQEEKHKFVIRPPFASLKSGGNSKSYDSYVPKVVKRISWKKLPPKYSEVKETEEESWDMEPRSFDVSEDSDEDIIFKYSMY